MIFEAPPVARGNDRLLTVCAPRKAAGLRSGGRSRWANWLVSLPFSAKLAQREHFDASAAPAVRTGTFLQRAWAPVWLQRYGAAEGRRVAFRWQSRAG
jgi:hypothetical protein